MLLSYLHDKRWVINEWVFHRLGSCHQNKKWDHSNQYIGNCDSNWQLSSKDKIPVDIYKVHKAIYLNREMAVLVLTIFQVLDELKIYSLNIYFNIYLLNLLVPTHMLLYV